MHDDRAEDQIWEDGRAIERLAPTPGRHLVGRATADVMDAIRSNLSVERDETPPNRLHHANLVHWALEKEKRLFQATILADASKGVLSPDCR